MPRPAEAETPVIDHHLVVKINQAFYSHLPCHSFIIQGLASHLKTLLDGISKLRPSHASHCVARFLAPFVYARLLSQSCWKTSPQRYHVMRLGRTSWQESDQLENFDRRSKFLEISSTTYIEISNAQSFSPNNLNLTGYEPGFVPNELNLIALLFTIIAIAISPYGR